LRCLDGIADLPDTMASKTGLKQIAKEKVYPLMDLLKKNVRLL